MYQQVFKLHADLLKAMAHPKRLEVLQLLREKRLGVSQIQEMLGLPQANLSQHLMVLRDAGVVKTRKMGKQVVYEVAHRNFIDASDRLREILIERHKDDHLGNELVMKMSDLVPVVVDPVCGMRVSPKTAAYAYELEGKTYYFCAKGCFNKFKRGKHD